MDDKQLNYTIAEGYELPSKGLIYDKQVNAHVELRSMTARDELKRQNPSSTPFKVLADIIEGCMIDKPAVHVYDMALGDYEYLLHKLRIVTYGPDYALGMTCPYCGEEIDTEANLDTLELKDFDLNEFNNLRTFTLPRSGKTISLKIQTPHMLDDIDIKTKEMKRKYRGAETDFETFVLLKSVIDTVDGIKLSELDLETFINNLPAGDMRKILNNLDKLNRSIGLDNTLFITCDKCGGEVRTSFRFGQEFFRPSNI